MIIFLLNFNIIMFIISFLGLFLIRKNFIIVLLCLELLLLLLNLNLILYSIILDDILGQIFCLLILTFAAAESLIGLALLILFYRSQNLKISIDFLNILKN